MTRCHFFKRSTAHNRPKPSASYSISSFSLTLVAALLVSGCQQPVESPPQTTADSVAPAATNPAAAPTDHAAPTATAPAPLAPANTTLPQANIAQTINQPITILALGDSLTEGLGLAENEAYPAQLQAALQAAGYVNAKVVNSGLSGETSSGLVNRLDWALKTKPDITILTIGANDAMRGIEVATVEKNIRTAIERLQSEGSIVVLGGMQIYDNLGDDYVQAFSDIYPKLAKEYDLAFIPFFLAGVGAVTELNQADGLHPTAAGYGRIVNDNIMPVLQPVLTDFVAKKPATATETAS